MAPTLSHSKILIVGTSGSGKSHVANRLSDKSFIPFYATDGLYWTENWELMSDEDVLSRISFEDKAWIIDGNFDRHWQEVWSRADLVVWLNFPLYKILFRVIVRNLSWVLGSSTWNGSPMPFDLAIDGISHAFRSYFSKRDDYPKRVRHLGNTSFVECKTDADVEELISMFEIVHEQ